MSVRQPGCSVGGFSGLNLATHVGDEPMAVAENRQQVARILGVPVVYLNQVHGCRCVELHATSQTEGVLVADAAVTRESHLACTVMVADCLPVLFSDQDGAQVAAAHAGWRGLAEGVLTETVAQFGPKGASSAWLGPCIGQTAFEVGDEVRAAFERNWGSASGISACFLPSSVPGKWLCDLAGLARWQLQSLGVSTVSGNDGGPGWCTFTNGTTWFSHRRDGRGAGGTGRMAAFVWIQD